MREVIIKINLIELSDLRKAKIFFYFWVVKKSKHLLLVVKNSLIDIKNKKWATLFMITLVIVLLAVKAGIVTILFLIIFFSFAFYAWDSRIIAIVALISLVGCSFLLMFKWDAQAKLMAIYAYYFLIITIILQILELQRKRFIAKQERAAQELDVWSQISPLITNEFLSPGLAKMQSEDKSLDLQDDQEIAIKKKNIILRLYSNLQPKVSQCKNQLFIQIRGAIIVVNRKFVYIFKDILFDWTRKSFKITSNIVRLNLQKLYLDNKTKKAEVDSVVETTISETAEVLSIDTIISELDQSPNFVKTKRPGKIAFYLKLLLHIIFSWTIVLNALVLAISMYVIRQTIMESDSLILVIKLCLVSFVIILLNWLIYFNKKD
jgi:hypothetical protein